VFVGQVVTSHYHYMRPALPMGRTPRPGRTVLAYESPGNHGPGGGMNILFLDAHVERIVDPTLMKKVAAELAAGQNPPPSKP
jgi:prepilin-type processing-associated H-X9-DG protein